MVDRSHANDPKLLTPPSLTGTWMGWTRVGPRAGFSGFLPEKEPLARSHRRPNLLEEIIDSENELFRKEENVDHYFEKEAKGRKELCDLRQDKETGLYGAE